MKERKFDGIGISPGIAISQAHILEMVRPVIWMHRIQEDQIEDEVERFRIALEETKKGLDNIKHQIGKEMGSEHAYIFDAHMLMLEDQMLVEATIEHIKENKVNAEFALQKVTSELSRTFGAFEDTYLRERGIDVLDVANRIQLELCRPVGDHQDAPDAPSIMLAHEIHPSRLASMDTQNILGIAMDVGGQTTHTGLIAIAKNIPAVVGLRDISIITKQGATVIVDGNDGVVIIDPTEKTLETYKHKLHLYHRREEELLAMRDLPSVTTDGVEISLMANVELTEELEPAFNKYGAEGVGLYRSEYIFLSNPKLMPTEKDHEEMYSAMVKAAGSRQINLRTVDLGGEKNLESLDIGKEANPALGLRAVRFALQRKSIFKAQIRGALRASTSGTIRILIPMVSGVGELRQVKQLIEECSNDLIKEGVSINADIEVGIMIEVPSAAIIADLLAKEVDFVSIGTNDLIQYVLAIDRTNESVAYLYEPFHPAVLRLLKDTADKVRAEGKPLAMCGEMAADPIATPLLIGMGYHEFSMNPLSIPMVKSVIRNVSATLCKDLADQVLTLSSIDDIYQFMREKLEHSYPKLKNLILGIPLGES